MALRAVVPNRKAKAKAPKKRAPKTHRAIQPPEIGAGEFKAKCLAIIDEVNRSGQEVIITKRGKAVAKLTAFHEQPLDEIFGRLVGIGEIVGDPDDLIKPVFPLEDYDMLK
jgi:prevent-host-death family protein